MQRKIIIASHHQLAEGMADTIAYITNTTADIQTLCGYMDNTPVNGQIDAIMAKVPVEDEVFIFTDLLAGSVNQGFAKFLERPHTHLITGMNLPIIMSIVLNFQTDYLTTEDVSSLVNQAKEALIYVNTLSTEGDEGDE